jgi:hypothetical protein
VVNGGLSVHQGLLVSVVIHTPVEREGVCAILPGATRAPYSDLVRHRSLVVMVEEGGSELRDRISAIVVESLSRGLACLIRRHEACTHGA